MDLRNNEEASAPLLKDAAEIVIVSAQPGTARMEWIFGDRRPFAHLLEVRMVAC